MATRKFYDDFARKSLKDMASSISDMTYAYNATVVPKEHYAKALSQEIEDLIAQDVNIEINLLEPFLKILTSLQKENTKYFFKALLMLEEGIKLTSIQSVDVDGLEYCWNVYDSSKPKDKKLLNDKILDSFDDIKKNGLFNSRSVNESDEDSDITFIDRGN